MALLLYVKLCVDPLLGFSLTEQSKIWCWVSLEWDALRIATFYAPVWIMVVATFVIYVRAGLVVFKWRDKLLHSARNHPPVIRDHEDRTSVEVNHIVIPSAEDNTGAIKTKYVSEREAATGISQRQLSVSTQASNDTLNGRNQGRPVNSTGFIPTITQRNQSFVSTVTAPNLPTSAQAKKAAINYCKSAILFFAALLVTWVPSSINRLSTLIHPESFMFGLDYATALVLPLQGFWLTVVYVVTNFTACQAMFENLGD
jgi:hypothetical protein